MFKPCTVIALVGFLIAGCQAFTRNIHSDMDVFMRTPVCARVDADLTPVPNRGPLQESVLSGGKCAAGKVAVIDIDGLLVDFDPVGPYSAGENPVAVFQEKLTAAASDPAVRAVVLRINSPGGGVAATDLMVHALQDFRAHAGKPVVASLLGLGTGGAYYLASACDRVIAIPTAVVGGIGVLLNLYYLEVAMEQWNVFTAPIKAGEHIDMGTSQRKMTDEEKAMLTRMAEEYQAQFRQAVMHGRPRVQAGAAIFDGRVLTTSQAIDAGLVDAAGYLPDAIAAACQLANVGPLQAIMYSRPCSPARTLYQTTPNRPVQTNFLPWSVPGLDRSRLPLFLYMWQAEPTMLRLTGI